MRDEAFEFFTGRLRAALSVIRANVDLPDDGEFAALGLERPLLALRCDDLTMVVPAPRRVPRTLPHLVALGALTTD